MKQKRKSLPVFEYVTPAKHKVRYGFRLPNGYYENGQPRTLQRRNFKTYEDAVKACLEAKKAIERGELAPKPKRYTFEDVYHLWLKQRTLSVKASTLYVVKTLFHSILPVFGKREIIKITVTQCQRAVNEWSTNRKAFLNLVNYTKSVFNYAVKLELISKSPFDKVDIPKRQSSPKNDADKFYTKPELTAFLEACKQERQPQIYVLFRLLGYSGLRKGEALGMFWQDVDFENHQITVRRTLTEQKHFQSTKTASSSRTISMDAKTMLILQKWCLEQRKALLVNGVNADNDQQTIFCNLETGKPLSLNVPDYWLHRIQKKHGFKRITVHGFRHTHCSLLFEAHIPPAIVQKRLGHRSIKTTLDIYTHFTDQQKQDTAVKFAKFMAE